MPRLQVSVPRQTFVLPLFFSSRRRHTRCGRDWSSDVCSSDLDQYALPMDWATNVLYYNTALVEKAGYTPAEMDKLTWNPQNGGALWTPIQRAPPHKKRAPGNQAALKP